MSKKKSIPFLTSPDSPFPDGYDLAAEEKVLAQLLLEDEPDTADPLFSRLVEYEQRQAQLKNMEAAKAAKATKPAGADAQVAAIGRLETEADDEMTIHTLDAMRLFVGRPAGNGLRPIAGGRRVAASLRQLWSLSANDNPYADWLLVQFDEAMSAFRADQDKKTAAVVAKLEAMKAKGLTYSVKRSAKPAAVRLGFVSPYGFTVAGATVEFDWASRVIKSAQSRDVLSSEEAHTLLFNLKRTCRSAFEPVVRGAGLLMREELRQLTRADFLSADDLAVKRVTAVQGLFGKCPKDVFIGKAAPRHTRRSVRLTDAELRLLESVPFADAEAGAAESSGLIE